MQIRKLLIILLCSVAFGQNIEDIVNIAVKNSYKLKSYKHTITSKKYVLKEAKDAYYPSASLFASISKQRYDQVYPSKNYKVNSQNIKYGVDVKQNLYNAKIFASIKDAKLRRRVTQLEKESYLLNQYRDVIAAYFEVLVNRENLKYYRLRKDSFQNILKNIKEQVKYKYLTGIDLSQAQSNYSIAKNDYIKTKFGYKNSIRKLQILVNSNQSFHFNGKISDALDKKIKHLLSSYKSYKTKLKDNPTIKSAALYTKIARNEINNRKYDRYPTLTLDGTYSNTHARHTSIYEKNNFRVSLNLNMKLYEGGAINDKISEAKELYIASQFDYRSKKRSLELDFNKNWDNLQTSLEVVKSDKQNIVKTKDYLRKAKKSFEYKLIALSDYYRAQNNYYQSLISFENDKLNLIYYYISLLSETGELKKRVREMRSFIH